jgi:hypothetical protein
MENYLRTELVPAAIDMAITMRGPQPVTHHSEHGLNRLAARSAGATGKPVACPRWARSEMRATTRWPSFFARLEPEVPIHLNRGRQQVPTF